MSIISLKSGLSPRRQCRGKVPDVYGEKDLWKGRFWADSGKEKQLRMVEMTMMYTNCHEWNVVNMKGTD